MVDPGGGPGPDLSPAPLKQPSNWEIIVFKSCKGFVNEICTSGGLSIQVIKRRRRKIQKLSTASSGITELTLIQF